MCKLSIGVLYLLALLFSRAANKAEELPSDESGPTKSFNVPSTMNGTIFLSYANNIFGEAVRVEPFENKTMDGASDRNILFRPEENDFFGQTEARSKRGVLHLYNMVSCATGCNPLVYKGYGCYCGFLGSGYAVDGIDRCCQNHDWCYLTANCPGFVEYIQPYYWKCYYNRPICAIEHGEFGGPGSCAQRLCECDRVLSECLRRFLCPNSRALCYSSPLRLLQNAFMIIP